MSDPWNGRYVLRAVEENHRYYHRIYKESDRLQDITSADAYFSHAPALASKDLYHAERVDARSPWWVTLDRNGRELMTVFILRRVR